MLNSFVNRLKACTRPRVKKEIVLQANELIRHKQLPDLNHYNLHEQIISTNWVKAFSERNKLIITESQNIQKEKPLPTNEDLVDYFVNLKRLKEKNNYQRGMIFNADETACFNNTDSVKIRVVTTEKIKNPIRKIPKSRFHITAVCTIADDGTYLPTLILDKRKTVERNFVDNFSTVPLSFVFSESGYMNQNLFHLFITSILLPNIRQRRKKIGKNAKHKYKLKNQFF
ncbi:hypothetical protein M0812_25963 [Anaeramoeba flamelloides]|uniref:DDE-1 domain-containing protein n=1 Tax=Anaeramoeba flamelloides TaxID=1746091 RepID=A0AAV7YHA9_9EUKA|nr:hypothetical protein M0812_25963 [Anaeramoeba flamelloides]